MFSQKITAQFTRLPCRQISAGQVHAALCWPKPDYGPMEVFRSNFLNGLKIAAVKPVIGAQMSACSMLFQAGSRYECDTELGANHFIRAATLTSGCGHSGYMRIRYMQEQGGYITCSSDRQTICFTLRCPLPSFKELKWYLLDTACRCCFKQIELEDKVKPMVRDDLTRRPPQQHVLDLVQKACWGGPLNNSVYCEQARINHLNEDILANYALTYFTTNLCTIGSVGVPFEELQKLAEHIECGKVDMPAYPSQPASFPRGGFEEYDLGRMNETWIAVAVPGCGTCDYDCLMKHAILAAAIGVGTMQTGSHAYNRLLQPPLGCLSHDQYTSYKGFNISYCETGVFGILARTRAKTARQVACSALQFLTCIGGLNYNQIEVGKRRLKVSLTLHDEECVLVAEGLAMQLASGHCVDSARVAMDHIDAIPSENVINVAKMIAAKCNQMAMAVVGDVAMAPHLQEMLCDFNSACMDQGIECSTPTTTSGSARGPYNTC